MSNENNNAPAICFVERVTAEMLAALKKTPWFADAIADAKAEQEQHGYAWDVALKISCNYWLS